MSFEIQELPDVIKIVILLELQKRRREPTRRLRNRLDRIYGREKSISTTDFDKAIKELVSEGLIIVDSSGLVELTSSGIQLSCEWENLFIGEEPVLETITGLTDGSVTSLVVILSSFLTNLNTSLTIFAALLSLISVSLTNFGSFFLGGKTEDLSDMISLQRIINFSLRDITDAMEREKSLWMASRLFRLIRSDLNQSNIRSAFVSGITTFFTGMIPISLYIYTPYPLNLISSLGFVTVVGFFLIRYRARKSRVDWRVTLVETVIILLIAVFAGLILGAYER
jgi:VIT1/CCC1 family predicted Fe2+/Mn2+ transporter